MPDLPPLITKALDDIKSEIDQMRRGGSLDRQKPHKFILLLAVIDLADRGELQENKIYFQQPLIKSFEKYFRLVSKREDWCQPAPPYFHLRTASFWKHKPKQGKELAYSKLTTSGGGTKRIQENIEYAFLSDDAFLVISSNDARQKLREFLLQKLRSDMPTQRLKTVFHESFSLSKLSLGQVLSVSTDKNDIDFSSREKRFETLRENTNLGTNYVKAMPRYAIGSGLLDNTYKVTLFGRYIQKHDPLMEQSGTQWLMHYHLSALKGPGPAFWHELVKTHFRGGHEFTTDEIAEQISDFFEQTEGDKLAERSARATATIFIGTYIKQDGLANLNLIQKIIGEDRYKINDDFDPPPTWAVAYAILDWWKEKFGGVVTINLDEFTSENGIANLFLIGAGKTASILQKMQIEGIVDIYRVSSPYQAVLLRSDPQFILEKLYAHE